MTAAAVISAHVPLDERSVHGIYRRLDTFVTALARKATEIHVLALTPRSAKIPEDHAALEQRLGHRWGCNVTLQIASTLQLDTTPPSRWEMYVRGALDGTRSAVLRSSANLPTLEAVRGFLRVEPDIVFAHRIAAMSAVRAAGAIASRVYFDLDDIEHIALARRVWNSPSWPAERLKLIQVPALAVAERRAIRAATMTFVCSGSDARYLRRFASTKAVAVVPNAVTLPAAAAPNPNTKTVLFLGAFGYAPNAVAADYLVTEIWPRVRAELPDARLIIAGGNPELLKSRGTTDHSVEFPGFVPDLADLYAQTDVVCCPILSGGGTRVKIVEAAAYGKPVVSTPLGAEGLDFHRDTEILLEADAGALASACVRLLKDPALAARIGEAARARAARLYDASAIINSLATLFERPERTASAIQRVADFN